MESGMAAWGVFLLFIFIFSINSSSYDAKSEL